MATTRKRKTKSNVVSLGGAALPIQAVNEQVVEVLEGLLSDARGGHLAGLAYAAVSPQGHVRTNWAGNAERHDMLAGVGILHHRMFDAA